MSSGAWMMVLVSLLSLGSLAFVVLSMVRSIRSERIPGRSVWLDFGLTLALFLLFLATWVGHGIAEWQVYTDEQIAHNEPVRIGDFLSEFGQSTLENWQSEFLQLFTFVVLAALYVHRGSAESKDGTDRMEASLRRIEEQLGTLPPGAPKSGDEGWKLPEAPS